MLEGGARNEKEELVLYGEQNVGTGVQGCVCV